MTPELVQLLRRWLPSQRWYPAKGREAELLHLGERQLAAPSRAVDIVVHIVGLDCGDHLDVVQVPLTYRSAPLDGAEQALVGTVEQDDLGTRWIYDGPHDPAYVAALLTALDHPSGRPVPAPTASRVLRGEQSNTSVIVDTSAGSLIVKVFRTLHPGANPDVAVARALDGSDQVPRVVGWLTGAWHPTPGPVADTGDEVTGHLAVATEFVSDGIDAWREAVEAVEAGRDFTTQARGLGEATARLHGALADALGTTSAGPQTTAAVETALRERIWWALRSTNALDRFREALTDRADHLTLTDVPDLQRVHGDYHLGQVLHSPSRGWVVLDFEGEPLRALDERTRPDLALRDVAGMLRSFDYAAGQVQVAEADPERSAAAQAWATAARDAFCEGYLQGSGSDPRERRDLLTALELDKALYEVVYEAGNRPAWIEVPLLAIERLLATPR